MLLTTAAVYAYHRQGRALEGFFVRQEAKSQGTRKIIEGKLPAGSRVAIGDDVATTGESILMAIEAVRRAESEPVLITVLVDRLEGAKEPFAEEEIPFHPILTIADIRGASAT